VTVEIASLEISSLGRGRGEVVVEQEVEGAERC